MDNSEAANHFRALVEGAAEKSLRGGEDEDDRDRADGLRNAALEEMRETKHMDIGEIFIYAKDLRDVLVTLSERLTDEEADQLIRECRPRPKKGAPDGRQTASARPRSVLESPRDSKGDSRRGPSRFRRWVNRPSAVRDIPKHTSIVRIGHDPAEIPREKRQIAACRRGQAAKTESTSASTSPCSRTKPSEICILCVQE